MALAPCAALGLSVLGFRRLKELIERLFLPDRRGVPRDSQAELEQARRIARAVRSAELHGLGRPNCLERSMLLWSLLRHAGIDGELHIGARKNGSRFEAHAWVEMAGQVLNDSADVHAHYARFDGPIAAREPDSRVAGKVAL